MNSQLKTDEPRGIRVLVVAPALPILGGQTVQAARLIEKFELVESIDVDLQPINPAFLPWLQSIKYVRTFVTSWRYIADLFFRIPRYDVIHIFSASYFSFFLAPTPAVLISKLFGRKTILNYRSGQAEDHLKRWKRTALPTIRLFDEVIVPSGYLVDVFGKFGIESRSISNFVEKSIYRFRERPTLQPRFLSNRNFEDLYNVSCTLRAFRLIQDRISEASLIVVGDGSERVRLRSLAEDLELKNVTFLGQIPNEQMPKIYDQADIYLNSPDIDNMPNSIIEAFACGLPVISTNAGGIPYIVEHNRTGLLVERDDHVGLAENALQVLSDDALAQSLISNAHAETSQYSWENVRDDWVELYRRLVTK